MRLFFAIRLPEDVLTFVVEAQSKLRPIIDRQGVRFAAPQKMHITVAFLGDDADASEAIALGNRFLKGSGPLHLRAGKLGAFPSFERPKTVWLAVIDPALESLGQSVSRALNKEEESFTGHITLARISPGSKAIGRVLQPVVPTFEQIIEWTAAEAELLMTLPNGEYETLHRFLL